MKYYFDEIIPRRHTHSVKWDQASHVEMLPMSIADMDFRTAPAVIDALQRRVAHGIFGYTRISDTYFQAVVNWFTRRHQFALNKDWLLYTTGVVPALSAVIRALTQPGDKVIVQTPVYNCFFSSIRNNGCEVVCNELIFNNGEYRIDFADLEEKAKDSGVKLLLLCSPHNPVGRVWNREELIRIGNICLEHEVMVVADEIHCDLVYEGSKHVPFASLSEAFLLHSVTCIAPTKTFNMAGVQVANILAADKNVRLLIDRALNINEVSEISPFAVEALIAAYNEGEEWLDELIVYLQQNYNYLRGYFNRFLPQLYVLPLEGTYLVWVDVRALQQSSRELAQKLLTEMNLRVNEGTIYGDAGEGFIRINIACPRQYLEEGLSRLKAFLTGEVGTG
ncbi:MalY/PatB family protein [Chitinophaga sancti]|uniref:cysteine-S-conjugate beta-lyase n=1 Tax=Chitinophaga sancti TaxID=1004 RepID=A0A1K1LX70_9BACT|nr:MalY/PatB family protein [Chitinophaga sancti]WQD64768.1 MalY/PatB family protein [Chitinophaga sancti]WQG89609.1 MalY/PatB family protein [Chitinophaga sancti]SFW15533.1 cystathione beta-lyase [Chitinophaga sancti]